MPTPTVTYRSSGRSALAACAFQGWPFLVILAFAWWQAGDRVGDLVTNPFVVTLMLLFFVLPALAILSLAAVRRLFYRLDLNGDACELRELGLCCERTIDLRHVSHVMQVRSAFPGPRNFLKLRRGDFSVVELAHYLRHDDQLSLVKLLTGQENPQIGQWIPMAHHGQPGATG